MNTLIESVGRKLSGRITSRTWRLWLFGLREVEDHGIFYDMTTQRKARDNRELSSQSDNSVGARQSTEPDEINERHANPVFPSALFQTRCKYRAAGVPPPDELINDIST